MIMSAHIAAGAAIAAGVSVSTVALPMALASHYALDSIPHWQETLHPYRPHEGTWRRVIVDALCSAAILLLAVSAHPDRTVVILTGAALALLPDADSILAIRPQWRRGLAGWHWRIHCWLQRETASAWGIIPQIIVVAVSLFSL